MRSGFGLVIARRVGRLRAALVAGSVAGACAAALIPGVAAAAPPATTLTFDELSSQPVDGVQIAGVTFGFRVGGAPSPGATYGAIGPVTTYVKGPSLVGTTAGTLTLRFARPTTVLEFGLALEFFGSLTPGATVELFNPGGHTLGTRTLATESLPVYSEVRFAYRGGAIGSATIAFSPSADRFALDNLTFRALAAGASV